VSGHWWQRPKPKLPIPPFKERREVEPPPEPMGVAESPGVDGKDTIIQKVQRFWGIKPSKEEK
jgi:hypothetical protein